MLENNLQKFLAYTTIQTPFLDAVFVSGTVDVSGSNVFQLIGLHLLNVNKI